MNRYIHREAHLPNLNKELRQFLPVDSLVARLQRSVAEELNAQLEFWSSKDEDLFLRMTPVEALFIWISKAGGLRAQALTSTDGRYRDDEGNQVPASVKKMLSGTEQLAAYGLWLISADRECCGPYGIDDWDENGCNEYGWVKDDAYSHRTECLLLAYQALTYAQRMILGHTLTEVETAKATKLDFVAIGAKGAEKRNAPMKALQAWTLQRYDAGSWKSARHASIELAQDTVAYGRTIGAALSPTNADRTIYRWIRESRSHLENS